MTKLLRCRVVTGGERRVCFRDGSIFAAPAAECPDIVLTANVDGQAVSLVLDLDDATDLIGQAIYSVLRIHKRDGERLPIRGRRMVRALRAWNSN